MISNEHYEPRLGRIHMSEYLGRRRGTRVKRGALGCMTDLAWSSLCYLRLYDSANSARSDTYHSSVVA